MARLRWRGDPSLGLRRPGIYTGRCEASPPDFRYRQDRRPSGGHVAAGAPVTGDCIGRIV